MTKHSIEYARKMSAKWDKALEKKVLSDLESREIYERKVREIELALMLRKAREKAHLTQEAIAARMHTTRTAVSRLEACGNSQRNSPSIQTLLKYAHALGYTLKIRLVPEKQAKVSRK